MTINRKKCTLMAAALCTLGLFACGDSSVTDNSTESMTSEAETATAEQTTATMPESTQVETQSSQQVVFTTSEPQMTSVKTYYIYAEQGAVITEMDPKTGRYSWKGKCESCGKTESTVHANHYLTTSASKQTSSFVCSNPNCSLRGKGQKVVIACDVTVDWVPIS